MTGAVLSVEKVNGYIQRIFEAETLLHDILVAGEISNFSLSGTTAYFVLKDERAAVNCVCFDARQKGCIFRNGDRAVVRATPNFYARLGKLSLLVSKAAAAGGQGLLYLKYAALREKFEREGKLDPARKRPIPKHAGTVGVVTSRSGAVIHDIITVARRRNPAVNILLSPARVQGTGAAPEIAAAIRRLAGTEAEVIIVARGGGSNEDIEPFWSEEVAEAVCSCPVPVVSAVGHETDFTLCDYAADVRAATPSVAAELCVFSAAEYEEELKAELFSAYRLLLQAAARGQDKLRSLAADLTGQGSALYVQNFHAVRNALTAIWQNVTERCYAAEAALSRERADLERLNPAEVLRRGYARIAKGGRTVSCAEELRTGDLVTLILADGRRTAQILAEKEGP